MKRTALMAVAVLFFASLASAQMMTGRPPGQRMGSVVPVTAGDMLGMGMSLVVAPDGSVITVERTLAGGSTELTEKVVAVNASGAKAWTHVAPGIGQIQVTQSLVLLTKFGSIRQTDGTIALSRKTQIEALSLATGATAWTLEIDGLLMQLEPSATQIYAVVLTPGTQTIAPGNMIGMMQGTRTLIAISNSGVVLWQMPLGR